MPKVIISDTSCLIILSKIGELNLLERTYGKVLTTPEVAAEYGDPLPNWIELKNVRDKNRQKLLALQIDNGEASAIALAIEVKDSVLIMDDYKARKVAIKLGLEITGTIGVIVKAKLSGKIKSVKPYLDKIRKTNFYLSKQLEDQAIKEAGE